jgi:S1-C subfamily serine protease
VKRLALLLCIVLGATTLSAAPWADVLGKPEKTVLRLSGATRDGEAWTCSAVVIGPGLAMTAAHCVDAAGADLVIGGRAASVVKSNRIIDLAVVKFLARDEIAVKLAPKTPSMGADVAVIGFALGAKELHAQFGHVAASRDADGDHARDVAIFHGDSGTFVFDKLGRLVGIISARQDDGSAGQGLAIPVETALEFIDGLS